MKKNTFKLLAAGLLLFSISSCGGDSKPESTDKETAKVEEAVVETVEKYAAGKTAYDKTCFACHQADGKGIEGAFPPLAGSDYLLEDKTRAITQIIDGSEGEITVNGKVYSGIMPPQVLTNEEVKDVMNYILNSWGNDGGEVTLEEVQSLKGDE